MPGGVEHVVVRLILLRRRELRAVGLIPRAFALVRFVRHLTFVVEGGPSQPAIPRSTPAEIVLHISVLQKLHLTQHAARGPQHAFSASSLQKHQKQRFM